MLLLQTLIIFVIQVSVTTTNVRLFSSTLSYAEIEAKEACTWLRAAGFPQYAQLYEGKDPGEIPPTSLTAYLAIMKIQNVCCY